MTLRFAFAICLGAIAAAPSQAEISYLRDFVLKGNEAVGLMPPEVVCEGTVRQAAWSPDGQYLLMVRENPNVAASMFSEIVRNPIDNPSITSLVLWNMKTKKSQQLWSGRSILDSISNIEWMPGTDIAYVPIHSITPKPEGGVVERESLLRVSAPNGQTGFVATLASARYVRLSMSPLKPVAVLTQIWQEDESSPASFAVSLLKADGSLTPAPELPRYAAVGRVRGWTQDGGIPYIGFKPRLTGENSQIVRIDFLSRKAEIVEAPQMFSAEEPKPPIPVRDSGVVAPGATRPPMLVQLWLLGDAGSDLPEALVCGDLNYSVSAPSADAIFFVTNGVGMIRRLARMPKDQFMDLYNAELKARIIRDAKQIDTAWQIYLGDHGDVAPTAGEDLGSLLNPYLKDGGQMMQGFVYTFAGGSVDLIKDPHNTEIGYKPGPGGRAVAFADGSVRWFPNKP